MLGGRRRAAADGPLPAQHVIKVGIVAHPSLLSVPDDLEKFKSVGTIPFLWNTCETDFAVRIPVSHLPPRSH